MTNNPDRMRMVIVTTPLFKHATDPDRMRVVMAALLADYIAVNDITTSVLWQTNVPDRMRVDMAAVLSHR